jgi:hypothetical protein
VIAPIASLEKERASLESTTAFAGVLSRDEGPLDAALT